MVSPGRDTTQLALELRLSPQAHEALSVRARQTGQSVDAVASAVVEQAMTTPPSVTPAEREARLAAFNEWMREVAARADRYPKGFVADDSRDSIYEGRGE